MQELAELFKQTSEVHFTGLLQQDADVKHILHALKGSSANIGLGALSAKCKQLELAGLTADEYQTNEHQPLQALWLQSLDALSQWLAEQV